MTDTAQGSVLLTHDVGLHARPSVKLSKLAKQFLKIIAEVKNPIFRDECLRSLASFLNLKVDSVQELSESSENSREPKPTLQTSSRRGPRTLPALDQEILRRIMFHRQDFARTLLEHPSICSVLEDETLSFCTLLLQVVDESGFSEEDKKREIARLLKNFGEGWLVFWKETYEIGNDPRASISSEIGDLSDLARLRGIESQIFSLSQEVGEEPDQSKKEEIHQRILDLRRLQTGIQAKGGSPLS